jgi:hypothetical protein
MFNIKNNYKLAIYGVLYCRMHKGPRRVPSEDRYRIDNLHGGCTLCSLRPPQLLHFIIVASETALVYSLPTRSRRALQ